MRWYCSGHSEKRAAAHLPTLERDPTRWPTRKPPSVLPSKMSENVVRTKRQSAVRTETKKSLKIKLTWSGQQDLNLRPSGPKPDALPDCAMPRAVPQAPWIHASLEASKARRRERRPMAFTHVSLPGMHSSEARTACSLSPMGPRLGEGVLPCPWRDRLFQDATNQCVNAVGQAVQAEDWNGRDQRD